jgi:hypothetical protein
MIKLAFLGPESPPMNLTEPTPYQLAILNGLQSRQVYAGTASPIKVAARRAKNRVAGRSRRINRLARQR